MKRRFFAILSGLSLLLCLACGLVWMRGAFAFDKFHKEYGQGRSVTFTSGYGGLSMQFGTESPPLATSREGSWWWFPTSEGMGGMAGIADLIGSWPLPAYNTYTTPSAGKRITATRELFLPYWLLTLSTSVLPALWWRRRWNDNRRQGVGRCRICGYDLRASKERCPECGTPVSQPRGTGTASD